MKTTTILEAYRRTEIMKSYLESSREQHNFGIAVAKDEKALDWQRRSRQANTFLDRLQDVTKAYDLFREEHKYFNIKLLKLPPQELHLVLQILQSQ